MPVFGLVLGVAICLLAAIAGQVVLGLGLFAIMAIYSAIVLAFGEREATVAGPDEVGDERLPLLTLLAIATAGFVAILIAFFAFLWLSAQGQSASPFAMLALAAGIGYLIVLLWFRWKR
jgi:ABC-type branched-subunit amino acid transport system permease subunit